MSTERHMFSQYPARSITQCEDLGEVNELIANAFGAGHKLDARCATMIITSMNGERFFGHCWRESNHIYCRLLREPALMSIVEAQWASKASTSTPQTLNS